MTEAPQTVAAAYRCNVCGAAFDRPIYESSGAVTITSLCQPYEGRADVFFCRICGHIQTTEIEGIADYYDREYRILLDSEEEDQLYEVRNGVVIYRTDHQVSTLLSKLSLPSGARVLDYGCAKGSTLRKLFALRPDVSPHLFDVSRMYVGFWRKFAPDENLATYQIPECWSNRFDVVTTFFSLEHVGNPSASLHAMSELLKPGGVLYGVVPNVFTNWADFVVADHVNHFSVPSLERALVDAGLNPLGIDDRAHTGAFVFHAERPKAGKSSAQLRRDPLSVADEVERISHYWRDLGARVREFESSRKTYKAAIYGSGFYGTFIAAALRELARVECFLDRNPFRQGKHLMGKPIIAPDALSNSIDTIYVGLNPASARKSIAELGWEGRDFWYFFP